MTRADIQGYIGVDYEIIFFHDGTNDDTQTILLDGDQDPPDLIDSFEPGVRASPLPGAIPMTLPSTAAGRPWSARALWRAFLLIDRERLSSACVPSARGAVCELARAGAERAAGAEQLLDGNVTSALSLFREAAVFHLAAYMAARTGETSSGGLRGDDVVTRFRALEPPAPLEGDPVTRQAFLESVRSRDTLEVDGARGTETREVAEAAQLVVGELAALVEPRGVGELRFLRRTRLVVLGLVGLVLVIALAASLGSRTNLALHKPVTTSGVHPAATSPPSGFTDGVTSGSYGVHTQVSALPWVTVDLLAVHAIDKIEVYNRGDGWFDDGLPLTVQVSTTGSDFVDVATRTTTFGQSAPWVVAVPHRKARFVRVHGAAGKYVCLSELEVFGD